MQQTMTMRQLTAAPPQEPPEAAETVEEEPESARAPPHYGRGSRGRTAPSLVALDVRGVR
jgi:hypothetical protein